MYDIVIGRGEEDKSLGIKGSIFLGRHYVRMGRNISLSNNVYMDVIRSHVVFIVGKRGSGKSYTMGVIAEGISDLPIEVRSNISIILLDTMGIYWTMKYPNLKEKQILKSWDMKPKALAVKVFVPTGYYNDAIKRGVPVDYPFSIKPSELDASDWCLTFDIKATDPIGVLIEKTVYALRDRLEEQKIEYDINDIVKALSQDKNSEEHVKNAAKNLFQSVSNWGLFSDRKSKGTQLSDLALPGEVTILDLSCYATMPNSWNIKNMVVGLVAEKLFIQRMTVRRAEEFQELHKAINIFGDDEVKKLEYPLVWLVLDEAHEFLPSTGKTLATDPLVTILREGRQPGISLILASQQPGKIHSDVMTQADTVIAHRITAKIDTEALGTLMQSYMREGLVEQADNLPREKGAAIVFDDNNERMYQIKMRPRFTWHGGSDPSAMPKKQDLMEEELKF